MALVNRSESAAPIISAVSCASRNRRLLYCNASRCFSSTVTAALSNAFNVVPNEDETGAFESSISGECGVLI